MEKFKYNEDIKKIKPKNIKWIEIAKNFYNGESIVFYDVKTGKLKLKYYNVTYASEVEGISTPCIYNSILR